jgi:hypothetical protein
MRAHEGRRGAFFALVILAALAACGGRSSVADAPDDAGAFFDAFSPAEAGLEAAQGGPDAASPFDAPVPVDCGSPSLVGTWKGTIEGFQSASGSNAVTMTFTETASGLLGTVSFGAAPPPPPPTDPDVGYPAGFFGTSSDVTQFFVDGFEHTAENVTFDGTRLRLGVWLAEVWKTWCALQTHTYLIAVFDGSPPLYGCLPNEGFVTDGHGTCDLVEPAMNQDVPVDCGKLALCHEFNGGSVCRCSADSCEMSTNPNGTPDLTFDMQLACDRLDGSSAGSFESLGVHLTRGR